MVLSVTTSKSDKSTIWDFAGRHSIAHYHLHWYSSGLVGRLLDHAPTLSSLVVDRYERYSEELLKAVLAPKKAAAMALQSVTLRCSSTPVPNKGRGCVPVKQAGSTPTADELVRAAVDTLVCLPQLYRVQLEGFTGRAFPLLPPSAALVAVTKLTLKGFPHADLGTMATKFPALCELTLFQCTVLCEASTDRPFSSLNTLVLQHCRLGASHLPGLHSLQHGDFAFCSLSSDELQTVLSALPTGGLAHLDLSGNKVSCEGAKLAVTKLSSKGGHLVLKHCHSAGLSQHVLLRLQKKHPNAVIVQ